MTGNYPVAQSNQLSMIIKKEDFFPYPPEKIWKALTDPSAISDWLMMTDFKAEVGCSFYLCGADGKIITGEVLEVIFPVKLVYSWKREGLVQPTTVTWSLHELHEGTLLRLEHDGFDDSIPGIFELHNSRWDGKFDNLKKILQS